MLMGFETSGCSVLSIGLDNCDGCADLMLPLNQLAIEEKALSYAFSTSLIP